MTRPAEPQLVVELKTGAVGLGAVGQEAAGLPAQVGSAADQTDGTALWGKVSATNQATIDIPLGIGSGTANTTPQIWWPESGTHNDIDLHFIDPSGNVRVSSISVNSVYERCRVAGAVAPGTWQLRIRGFSASLAFVLRTADDQIPVYASGVMDVIGSLVGPRLRLRGKIVDLTVEGATRELWIATARVG